MIKLVNLAFLYRAAVFFVFNLQLHRLYLHRIGILLVLAGLLLQSLQIGFLLLQGADLVGDTLQLQLCLL